MATMEMTGVDGATLLGLGRRAVIASFFPLQQVVQRRYRSLPEPAGHLTNYMIPACALDAKEPVTVVIGDAFERHYLGEKRWAETVVPGGAPAIAQDIVQSCRDNAVHVDEGRHPAIWICAGSEPSAEEKGRWLREQEAYFKALAAVADDALAQGKKEAIGTLHRLAGTWLRLDPRRHQWMRDEQRGDVKVCPLCRTQIDSESIVCTNCHQVVDPVAFAQFKAQGDEAARYLQKNAPNMEPPSIEAMTKVPALNQPAKK